VPSVAVVVSTTAPLLVEGSPAVIDVIRAFDVVSDSADVSVALVVDLAVVEVSVSPMVGFEGTALGFVVISVLTLSDVVD